MEDVKIISKTAKDNYLLQKKMEVKSLHDKYLNDPEIKLHWYEKYNTQEVSAFVLSLVFMSTMALIVLYFLKIDYFKPVLIDKQQMTVKVKSIVKQGDVIIRVLDEESLEKTTKKLDEKLADGLKNSKKGVTQNPVKPPSTNISMSNGISIQVDQFSRPFDIVIGDWLHRCNSIKVKVGDEIQVSKNMYYREYDKTYFYHVEPIEPLCESVKT